MKLLYFALLFLPILANASEEKVNDRQFSVGASADFYYLYSPDRKQETTTLSQRVYDRRSNDFTLNLISLDLAGKVENVSLTAQLDFGDFADQNAPESSEGISHNIGQAYLTYEFSDALTLSVGKMYTHVGYEVARAIDNWNYSRSIAFSIGGPYWHEGAALKYTSGGFQSGLFVYDGWDHSAENNGDKAYGVQLGYSTDNFHFLTNFISSKEKDSGTNITKTVCEFNTHYAFNDWFSAALNGVSGKKENFLNPAVGSKNVDQEWLAWVIYFHFKASEKWSFTPRFELFSDESKGATSYNLLANSSAQGAEVKSYTLTSSYMHNANSEIRFEYRVDSSNQKIYLNGNNGQEDSVSTLSMAFLFKI